MHGNPTRVRRCWRERIELGIDRAPKLARASSTDRKPGRRCGCGDQRTAPGYGPRETRLVSHPGPIVAVGAERRHLMAAGRPERRAAPDPTLEVQTVRDLARVYSITMDGLPAPSTLRAHNAAYRRSVDGPLGRLPLLELTRARVVGWMSDVSRAHGRYRTRKAFTALRTFLNVAGELKLVSDDPLRVCVSPVPVLSGMR